MSESTNIEKNCVTAAQMEDRLRYRFAGNEWAILFNVRNAGGFEATRAADAIAIGVWPSTGHRILGFEIKVSRADWLRELKDPWKSEAFAKFCDRWSLVIPRADIVKPGELPDGWGVMVPHGHGLKVSHEAKTRERVEPLDRGLLAAMLKRASTITIEAGREHYNRGLEDGKQRGHSDYKWKCEELDQLKAAIKEFEDASGVTINQWQGGRKIGEAVKFVLAGGLASIRRDIKRIDDVAVSVRKEVASLALPEDI